MFSKFMNLHEHRQKMIKQMMLSSSWGVSVTSFLGCKGFACDSEDLLPDNDPFQGFPGKVYLVQITSQLNGSLDNSHAVVIYNGKLYDINHTIPLSLTKENVNLCCVGSEWKFHSVSRVTTFVPTIKMKKYLDCSV